MTLLAALAAMLAPALTLPPAAAAYNPAAGEEYIKSVAGVAYVVLLMVFAFRLLRKRAKNATSTRFGGDAPAKPRVLAKATPLRAAW